MKRMSLRRFGRIVARVMATLPAEFAPHLANLAVDVEDEADVETLRRMDFTEEEIADGESLYGLFEPLEAGDYEGLDVADRPHRLIIYKNPLEDDFPDRRELLLEIRKTVIHELAHHFGYSERDLDGFEAKDDPFRDGLTERLDEDDHPAG
jgi:predicted Zn-dependent protease with MMP-like domain